MYAQQQPSYGNSAPSQGTGNQQQQYGDAQQQQQNQNYYASQQTYQQPTYTPQTQTPAASDQTSSYNYQQPAAEQASYNYQQPQQQTSYAQAPAPAPAPSSYPSQTQTSQPNAQQSYAPVTATQQPQQVYQQQTQAPPQQQTGYTQPQTQQQSYEQQQQNQQQQSYAAPQTTYQQQTDGYSQPTGYSQQPVYGQQDQQQQQQQHQPQQPQQPQSQPAYVAPQASPQQQPQQQIYQQYGPPDPSPQQAPQQPSWGQQPPNTDFSQQMGQGQKRGFDQMQGPVDFNAPKTARIDEVPEGQDLVNVLIPSDQVGLCIGKSGAIMKKIVNELQCRFALQEHQECPIGAKERILTLVGRIENLEEAERILLDALQNKRGKDQEVLKWLINADQVGLVIGRAGSTIKNIKETSGANLKIAHEQEMPAGSRERLLYLTGNPQQVEKARQMIASKVGGRPYEQSSTAQDTLTVPARAVGFLLGQKASELKKITEAAGSGVRINIALDSESKTGDGTRKARFTNGTPESVQAAKQMLQERVDLWKREQQMGPTVSTEGEVCLKLGIHAAMVGHCIGRGGSFIKQINTSPNIAMKVLQEEPSRSVVQDIRPLVLNGPIANVLQAQRTVLDHLRNAPDHLKEIAAQRAVLPPPAMMGGPQGPMGPPPMMMPPGFPGQMPPAYQQPGQMPGYGGPAGYPPQQGAAFGGNHPINEALRTAYGVLNIIQIPNGLEISVTAQIISKIVGPGGATIRRLSQNSGCNIQAQKRETVLPGQMDRKISVKGSPSQVEIMQQELLQVLQQL